MLCCGYCFGDDWLTSDIEAKSQRTGKCRNCQSENVALIKADNLTDLFSSVLGVYEKSNDGDGDTFLDLLKKDWEIFTHGRFGDDIAGELLKNILTSGVNLKNLLVPAPQFDKSHMTSWEKLREELKHKNRFFPEMEFDSEKLEKLQELLESLLVTEKNLSIQWHRCRIQFNEEPFKLSEMGAPPRKLASSGRANPVGIPYLYLACDVDTAIAEVRPHPGSSVCVAEFSVDETARYVDLREPRKTVSPFMLGDETRIGVLRREIGFLESLGQELKAPIVPNEAAIEYIPTQYLCELMKKFGFDGVLYKSSLRGAKI